MSVYFDFRDWWVGYYRGETHHYVCPLPTLVIRWSRRSGPTPAACPHDVHFGGYYCEEPNCPIGVAAAPLEGET